MVAFGGLLVFAACSNDLSDTPQAGEGRVTITSDIAPFSEVAEGDLSSSSSSLMSRVNVEGDDFIDEVMSNGNIVVHGDYIRLKIICPFVSSVERGETTDGYSYDALYFLKRKARQWARVVEADGFDITGSYRPSGSPDIATYYEAQQTPYVYVATTISEERRFVAPNDNGGSSLYDHLTPVFHADQTKEKHYRASDVLWAQTFMQTGAWNIHLGFQHKMACLDITIDDELLPDAEYKGDGVTIKTPSQKISSDAVLTLEKMPDIDQAEIVVGDYYADASKINSTYGYREKSSCSYENNGKVLGIAVNDEAAHRAKVWPMSGNPASPGGANSAVMPGTVPNTATYTAYKMASKHYRLIVPPCTLTEHAVFWLRDGTRRFQVELSRLQFVEGKLYPITLKLEEPLT